MATRYVSVGIDFEAPTDNIWIALVRKWNESLCNWPSQNEMESEVRGETHEHIHTGICDGGELVYVLVLHWCWIQCLSYCLSEVAACENIDTIYCSNCPSSLSRI